jgi:hypothetical protein
LIRSSLRGEGCGAEIAGAAAPDPTGVGFDDMAFVSFIERVGPRIAAGSRDRKK